MHNIFALRIDVGFYFVTFYAIILLCMNTILLELQPILRVDHVNEKGLQSAVALLTVSLVGQRA